MRYFLTLVFFMMRAASAEVVDLHHQGLVDECRARQIKNVTAVTTMLAGIQDWTQVEEVNVSENYLSSDGALCVLKMLEKSGSLELVNFSNNHIRSTDQEFVDFVQELGKLLLNNKTVRINLSINYITSTDVIGPFSEYCEPQLAGTGQEVSNLFSRISFQS